MARPRLCAVSVDLDEVGEHAKIHGLEPFAPDDPAAHAVHDRALPRVDAWASALSIPVSFFAIGRELERRANAEALRALSTRGHRVECHSLSHRYDLTRLSRAEIRAEVEGGIAAVERAVGARPSGFRAPGYTVCDALFDALDEAGVAFDSSVFPCPAYHAAKASVLAWMRLRGRASASVLDTPSVLFAPRAPYRPGRPYFRAASRGRGRRFVELPIQVTPVVRLPVIGTSVGRAGDVGARLLAAACASSPLVNLELHGMDFIDPSDLGSHPLVRLQPELGATLAARLDRLSAFVETLRARGFAFVTLAEAASTLGATL